MHALSTDLYQLTMAAGYFHRKMGDRVATCEMFVRRMPEARRYLVAMGLETVAKYLLELRFEEEDIAFLKSVPALADAMTLPAIMAPAANSKIPLVIRSLITPVRARRSAISRFGPHCIGRPCGATRSIRPHRAR